MVKHLPGQDNALRLTAAELRLTGSRRLRCAPPRPGRARAGLRPREADPARRAGQAGSNLLARFIGSIARPRRIVRGLPRHPWCPDQTRRRGDGRHGVAANGPRPPDCRLQGFSACKEVRKEAHRVQEISFGLFSIGKGRMVYVHVKAALTEPVRPGFGSSRVRGGSERNKTGPMRWRRSAGGHQDQGTSSCCQRT